MSKYTKKEWLYLPNLITLFRLATIPIPVVLIAHDHDLAALLLILVGIASDIADGYLARRLDQVSELGKILDPLSDKLAIASLVIALYFFKGFPLWALVVIIGRDLVILLGGLFFFMAKAKPIPTSNLFGKLTAFAWSLLLVSYLTPFVLFQQILLVIAPAMVPLSCVFYLRQVATRVSRKPNS